MAANCIYCGSGMSFSSESINCVTRHFLICTNDACSAEGPKSANIKQAEDRYNDIYRGFYGRNELELIDVASRIAAGMTAFCGRESESSRVANADYCLSMAEDILLMAKQRVGK